MDNQQKELCEVTMHVWRLDKKDMPVGYLEYCKYQKSINYERPWELPPSLKKSSRRKKVK